MAGELSLGGDDDPDDDVEPEQNEEGEDYPQQDHVNVEVLCQPGADAADPAVLRISSKLIFYCRLLLGKFLIHFEEAGDDVGFSGVFGEAVGLQDGDVVSVVGLHQIREKNQVTIKVSH